MGTDQFQRKIISLMLLKKRQRHLMCNFRQSKEIKQEVKDVIKIKLELRKNSKIRKMKTQS